MRVEILAFAALREALGASRGPLEVPEGATAGHVRARLADLHPRWRDLIAACRLARGVEFLEDTAPVREGEEIALIPPVSGGAEAPAGSTGPGPPAVALTAGPLDAPALRRAAGRAEAGAVTVFEGTARSPSHGREVTCLHYEAHEPMAVAAMERIVAEARRRWPLTAAFLHHRLGPIAIGEVSVIAVASAPHRAAAFDACRYLIEALKADVPIWKKEFFADGSVWVGAPGECVQETMDEGPDEAGKAPPGPTRADGSER